MKKISWRRDRLPTPVFLGFPGGSDGKESALQCGRPGFDPWLGKIPWRRAWQSTSVFLSGESPWTEEPGGYIPQGHKGSDTTEQLTLPLSLSILSKEPYSTPDVGLGFKPKQNIKGINSSMVQPSTDLLGGHTAHRNNVP